MSYLTFNKVCATPSGKTFVWDVWGTISLGQIRWYAPWRKYAFFANSQMLFDAGCLEEIANFLRREMEKHNG